MEILPMFVEFFLVVVFAFLIPLLIPVAFLVGIGLLVVLCTEAIILFLKALVG
ncbi:hypothetical protein [Lyngbya sp. PCC 8106]|uniref:hypothetical protein n=1 Tax=Lyngbya sp. (strain PCC 8106) TaxID=313612 RepID=UPI0000EA990A|nr:hypothetical protein [Lyngbya sp. PCC 8106]EAW35179.1 hypothetical protein L8106_13730 [Lyngbya sp. PCC 8106]